jgi:PAS domain S-box-containing protein
MPELSTIGGDLERALESVHVPSYVIDTAGVIRWVNPSAQKIVGDIRGRQFTSIVALEETRRAREVFARKIIRAEEVTDAKFVIHDLSGQRVEVEVSSVPLMNGDHVVGVFGQVTAIEEDGAPIAPPPELTPRQTEILRALEQGRSTSQIANDLKLSPETVRNHVRNLLLALGVHSRLEAVAVARGAFAH